MLNLRTSEILKRKHNKKTNNNGRESTSVIGATLWDLVPIELKDIESYRQFQNKN